MSNGSDSHSGDDPPGSEADEGVERTRRELEQRKRGLDDLADELDEREAELDERARELREKGQQLDEREAALDEREKRIREREAELDDREVALNERERDLSARAEELDEKEGTLQQYVNDSVGETVEEAVSRGLANDASGRFGTIGSLVLALVGVMLVVGGVLAGFATEIAMVPVVFSSDVANLALTVLLLFSGLAANLAAVAD